MPIKQNREKLKKVAFFGVGGDKKKDSVLNFLEEATGKKPKAKLYLCDKKVKADESEDEIKEFG